jgi:Na+-driven multidrug efflux pump
VLAGALRGRGDARGPMLIMMACFIGVRQIYLFVVTHFVANTPALVGFGYPVGWMSCCVVEVIYWVVRWKGKQTWNSNSTNQKPGSKTTTESRLPC